MNNTRRLLLKGLLGSTTGGLLLSNTGLVHAAMNLSADSLNEPSKISTILFTSDAKVESSFGAGVKAALPSSTEFRTVRTSFIDVLPQFNQLIKDGKKTRLIGLVDDATAEILVAQARHVGARISWLGQHMSSQTQSRHQVINNYDDQNSLLLLEAQLKKSSTDFELQANQPFNTVGNLKASYKSTTISSGGNTKTDPWAAHLGYALTMPKAKINSEFLTKCGECLEGQFFSFVVEV